MKIEYFENNNKKLFLKYDSPIYVYFEDELRRRCREMRKLLTRHKLKVNFACKANSNLELMKIVLDEGIGIDAVSNGEIYAALKAGFDPSDIFFVSNSASEKEMQYAIDKGVLVSVDSLSSLKRYAKLNYGGEIALRINPGIGDGHSDKVNTAGENTKFGIVLSQFSQALEIIASSNLKLVGINQHIGSLFLESRQYLKAMRVALDLVLEYDLKLDFIDFGGGFGIPYREDEPRLNLAKMSESMSEILDDFMLKYSNKDVCFKIEPGRYIVAECGYIIGTVNAVKDSYGKKYIGTDVGFSVLIRPTLYDSYHEVIVLGKKEDSEKQLVTIVGNICESGDIIAQHRLLPEIVEDDKIVILDAGAYGYSMSSNYNLRERPAEVLINLNGEARLIRKRESFENLVD